MSLRLLLVILLPALLLPVLLGAAPSSDRRLTPLVELGVLQEELEARGEWLLKAEVVARRADDCTVLDHEWFGQLAMGYPPDKLERKAKGALTCWKRLGKKASGSAYNDEFVDGRLFWTSTQLEGLRSLRALLAGDTPKRCVALEVGGVQAEQGVAAFDALLDKTQVASMRDYLQAHRDEIERLGKGFATQRASSCTPPSDGK